MLWKICLQFSEYYLMTEIKSTNISDPSFSNGTGKSVISVRDITQVLIVTFLWSLCYPLITTGLTAFPPFHFAAVRSVLAGVSLLVAGIVFKRPLIPDRDTWFSLVIISFTFTTLGFTGMFLAGNRVTPGLATVIGNVQPLLAALLGYFILAERLTGVRGLALLIGFAGIVVIAVPGLFEQSSNTTPVGISLVLAGATGVAIGNVLLKHIANRVDPLMAMAWILLLGAIPLILAAAVFENTASIGLSIASVLNLVVLSIFGTAMAFVLWIDVLRRAELNLLNTYTFLTPVFALFIGILFYNERLLNIEWVGVAVVVFAVFLVSRTNRVASAAPHRQ